MFGESLLFTFLVIGAKAQNYFEWSNHDGIQVSLKGKEDLGINRGETGKMSPELFTKFCFRALPDTPDVLVQEIRTLENCISTWYPFNLPTFEYIELS